MSGVQNFVERSELWRRKEEIQAVRNGEEDTSGSIKDVYQGLRGVVKPMHESEFAKENHDELTSTSFVADADVNSQDLTEFGYWEDTRVINQDEAVYTLEEAIDEFGVAEAVYRTVDELLDGFTENGIVYNDVSNNIGFFYGEPRAFDVYDSSAFTLFDKSPEEMSGAQFYLFEVSAPIMYQKFAQDVVNKSDEGVEEAIGKVAQASDYLDEGLDGYLDFQDAFECDSGF